MSFLATLNDVLVERERQDEKWGEQNHPDGTGDDQMVGNADWFREQCALAFKSGFGSWRHVMAEEVAEAFAEIDPDKLTEELVHVIAVAFAWIEAIERRTHQNPDVGPPFIAHGTFATGEPT